MRADLKKIWGRISPNRSLQFTRSGKQAVALTIAVGLVAVNTGHNPFYLIVAMMLSSIILSGILSEQALRRLRIERIFPTWPFAGTSLVIQYRLTNRRRRLASFCVQVGESDYPNVKTPMVYRIAPGEKRILSTPLSLPKRGRYPFNKLRIETAFPFGFFRKILFREQPDELIVYPKRIPLPPHMIRGILRGGGTNPLPSLKSNQPDTIKNLRIYQEGEDAKSIHWKATARHTKIILKEYEQGEEMRLIVCLGNFLPHPRSETDKEDFEKAVSLAASLVYACFMGGFTVGLKTNTEDIPLGRGLTHLARILQVLALITPAEKPSAPSLSLYSNAPMILILPRPDPFWEKRKSSASRILDVRSPELASFFAGSVPKGGADDN